MMYIYKYIYVREWFVLHDIYIYIYIYIYMCVREWLYYMTVRVW